MSTSDRQILFYGPSLHLIIHLNFFMTVKRLLIYCLAHVLLKLVKSLKMTQFGSKHVAQLDSSIV